MRKTETRKAKLACIRRITRSDKVAEEPSYKELNKRNIKRQMQKKSKQRNRK